MGSKIREDLNWGIGETIHVGGKTISTDEGQIVDEEKLDIIKTEMENTQ